MRLLAFVCRLVRSCLFRRLRADGIRLEIYVFATFLKRTKKRSIVRDVLNPPSRERDFGPVRASLRIRLSMSGAGARPASSAIIHRAKSFVELNGIEPMTSGLQSQRSPN